MLQRALDALGRVLLPQERLQDAGAQANAALERQVAELSARVDQLAGRSEALAALDDRLSTLLAVVRHAAEDEATTRRLLVAARAAADYELAYLDDDPLVSICIPTYSSLDTLMERAIPSALAQDHTNIEVIVVGDAAASEVGDAIQRLDDPRVRYDNLTVRGQYPDDPHRRWLVAGSTPANRAMQLARGRWIALLNDDDAFRPGHVTTLLRAARTHRCEVAYGAIFEHHPDGTTATFRTFPPVHPFGWQSTLQHGAMRLFEFELAAHLYDEPGDWHRTRRMLRAGVSFAMVDDEVVDYFPSGLWSPR